MSNPPNKDQHQPSDKVISNEDLLRELHDIKTKVSDVWEQINGSHRDVTSGLNWRLRGIENTVRNATRLAGTALGAVIVIVVGWALKALAMIGSTSSN